MAAPASCGVPLTKAAEPLCCVVSVLPINGRVQPTACAAAWTVPPARWCLLMPTASVLASPPARSARTAPAHRCAPRADRLLVSAGYRCCVRDDIGMPQAARHQDRWAGEVAAAEHELVVALHELDAVYEQLNQPSLPEELHRKTPPSDSSRLHDDTSAAKETILQPPKTRRVNSVQLRPRTLPYPMDARSGARRSVWLARNSLLGHQSR